MNRKILVLLFALVACNALRAQFLMDMIDTTNDLGKGMLSIYQRFDHIRIGGYIQPQFQWAQEKGAKSFEGGDFNSKTDNRFMLRRGRIRFDYLHFAKNTGPSFQFVFQFDGTERGVFIRDFWGRIFENNFKLFSFTAGMFARPFGYEVNLSSSDRESPERGRMSQLLMKTERDLGVMLTLDSRNNGNFIKHFKLDAGIFNGQGLSASSDFDSHKDVITRLALKPVHLSKKVSLSAAVSYYNGGFVQNTKYIYQAKGQFGVRSYQVDSLPSNEGKIAPRIYYGADMQVKLKTSAGYVELRGEFIAGKQTSSELSTESPSSLFTGKTGYYIRQFNGAYFYLLANLFNPKHQLGIKYDWYDPNTKVGGTGIGSPGTNFNEADIRYATLGFGYNYYMNTNVRLLLWYNLVNNEKTALTGYTSDLKDDVFTCRLQFRF